MGVISGAIEMDATRARSEKGLKGGALGLISSTVVGVASTAPAYSLAATLGFVVVLIGVKSPIVTILAFVPMLLISVAYNELNRANPDCGTTFTWATRAFARRRKNASTAIGWAGGWGIVAADVLVMASLAQIAGQYVFLLFNTSSIGGNARSGWVLLVGVAWIVAMTVICYVGIEVSANFQKALLGIELTMLTILSIVALVKVSNGTAPLGHLAISSSWFNPLHEPISSFAQGLTLMLFIYWGWDTAVSVNEETANRRVTPGRAAVIATFVLLAVYELVILSSQSYAGIGKTGIGLGNPAHVGDVLSVLGGSIFGTSGFGSFLSHLLLLMVLTSAAASTQTTILPTARTTLSMAVFRAIPKTFATVSRRFLTPSVSTAVMGVVSIGLYVIMNYVSSGNSVIVDSVTALGAWIAFYYGLTGLACIAYYRKTLTENARNLFMRGIIPLLGWAIMWSIGGYSLVLDWGPGSSYSHWKVPGAHWVVGGAFLLAVGTAVVGVILYFVYKAVSPAYFRGEVLNRDTTTTIPEDLGEAVGLFGIEERTTASPSS